jgi:sugar phosphate isomerase/epimerase
MESIALTKGDQIAVCHFNDSPASPPRETQRDADRVLPGDGCVDLRRFVALLRQVGYNRWLSLELFREDLWAQNPLDVAKLGLEKMRAVVET